MYIEINNKMITISTDSLSDNEEELLEDLNLTLSAIIGIYKRKIEIVNQKKMAYLDELVINKKIKDSIVFMPIELIRDHIIEM